MIVAHALGEYGGITGGMLQRLRDFLEAVEDHVRNPDASTVLYAAVIVFIFWYLFLRRR